MGRAEEAVQETEARPVGVVTWARAVLGSVYNSPAGPHQRKGKALPSSRGCESRSGGDGNLQGSTWRRWENVVERKVNRIELWKPHHIQCLIRAVYNLLTIQ